MKRLTRRRGWDSGGVSEIIGTILILGLTVVLFSSIIAFVGRIPPPTKSTSASFVGRVQPFNDNWVGGAEIFITHNGGRSLRAFDAKVILTVNGTSTAYDVADYGSVSFDDFNADGVWNPADVWRITLLTLWPSSIVDASVIDMERNTYVWGSKLRGGNQTYGPLIMDAWADSDTSTAKRDPIQNNLPFTFYVRLSDPNGDLNVATPTVDLSRLLGAGNISVALTEGAPGVFQASRTMGMLATHAGYYPATVRAVDLAGHVSTRVVLLVLGREIGAVPEIHLSVDNVTIDPTEPTNGDDVDIRVKASNIGLGNATVLLEIRDGVGGPVVDWSMFNIGGSPDELTEMYTWRNAGPGGNHKMFISAVVTSRIPDADTSDNYLNYSLTVMPTILLVDDDAHDGGELDSTRYLREALDSGGFEYDLYTVPGGSGPAYNSGPTQLINYDVVIWNTGYESAGTLTKDDQKDLDKFLADTTGGRTNTGSLWMIGQNFLADTTVSASTIAFPSNDLHVSAFSSSLALTNPLRGNPAHEVSQNWSVPAKWINVTAKVPGQDGCYALKPTGDGAMRMFNRTAAAEADAVSYEHPTRDSRVVTFGWDFGRIKDLSVQTDVAYATVLWLGNLTEKSVVDFAVSGQTIVPQTVYFKQTVTITASIRNNGAEKPGTADNTVSADIVLDGVPLTGNNSYRAAILVPGNGGKVTQTWTWNATIPGVHSLIVRVDPNGDITESNERNNQAGGLVTATTINVLFRLLVVDDDGSLNNGGALANETSVVKDALMGFGCVYENATIANGNSFPATVNMENYSAIIWVTGGVVNSLTAGDVTRLTNYMTMWSGRVWLQGRNSTRQLDAVFMGKYFGVGATVWDQALPGAIVGVTGDALGHGIRYGGAGTCDVMAPAVNGTGYLYQNSALGRYIGVRSTVYSTVVNSFSMADLANGGWQLPTATEARQELAFLVMDWLGRPESRSELKISCVDVVISDLHPQIGNSYVVRATVRNLAGYSEASALVRFMDENTTIGSDSIGVSPDQASTAEVIWTPLATGKRTLRVLVDPLGEQAEVFEWFNNNASYCTYVYFFFDDMENGTGKWSHQATVININNEGPLDFLPVTYTNVKTDVKKDWDYGTYPASALKFTSGVVNKSTYYHSYNESYYMEEPTGAFGVANVLVSFVIDDSGSMEARTNADGQTWLLAAKNAAKSLLDQLSDDSVCVSIWDFNANHERRYAGPNNVPQLSNRYDTQVIRDAVRLGDTFVSTVNGSAIDGRQKIRDEISAMSQPGQTLLWDSIGGAYTDIAFYSGLYPDLLPAVVALSDGADCQANDNAPIAGNKIEGGSAFWCPWADMSLGTQAYSEHKGKYTMNWANPTGSAEWLRAMTHGGSMDNDRKGLLNPNPKIKIFTVGLGLEHHDMPPTAVTTRTVWPGEILDGTYALCTDVAVAPPCKESGTLEYNLWRISNTSGAKYYYAPNADDLIGLFADIGQMLGSGFNQTRSAPAQPSPNAVNVNKQAVSPAVDLSGYKTAKLSFAQKYNMLPGGNGGVIGVEVRDPPVTGAWKFLYIIPSGVYTGGLYYPMTVMDGFNNQVKWCFNGVSGGGTFAWDRVELDVMPYIEQLGTNIAGNPDYYKGSVRVAFKYIQFGGGTGIGWYLDDVQLNVGRADATVPTAIHADVWNMTHTTDRTGAPTHAWWNRNPAANGLKPGIDNALTTTPIDLSNAVSVTLGAYFKFNINTADGVPPDCVRVEVTPDAGASWYAINLGVRGAWGLSGSGNDASDGKLDGKSYTGIGTSGGWVEAGTLARLNVDLSAWRGKQIQVRFRIVTNNLATYAHYASPAAPWGVYIDDVTLTGLTKFG